jgi:hypothetical protein
LGFDFAYGYPTGFAAALGLKRNTPPWRQVWDELSHLVVDDVDNHNNRFEVAANLNGQCGGLPPGPLWGCPVGGERPTLRATSPGYPYVTQSGHALERLRWVDRRERGVQPGWKLYGAGSVGGQCLVGIPAVCRLRDDADLYSISKVWPFETGFTSSPTPEAGPFVLHSEIWPGVAPRLNPDVPIRDQAQVRAVAEWLSATDASDQLGSCFATPVGLPPEGIQASTREEGWILGGGMKAGSFV